MGLLQLRRLACPLRQPFCNLNRYDRPLIAGFRRIALPNAALFLLDIRAAAGHARFKSVTIPVHELLLFNGDSRTARWNS